MKKWNGGVLKAQSSAARLQFCSRVTGCGDRFELSGGKIEGKHLARGFAGARRTDTRGCDRRAAATSRARLALGIP